MSLPLGFFLSKIIHASFLEQHYGLFDTILLSV